MNPKLMKTVVNNLYLFYRAFVANNFERNVHAPHIQILANEITKLTFQEGYKDRLCVSMPPQHSKSSLITVAYTVWLILQNPKTRILVVNAEGTLSEMFGLQIRDLISKIGPLFGVTLSNVKSSSTHLMFEKNGQLTIQSPQPVLYPVHLRLIRFSFSSKAFSGHNLIQRPQFEQYSLIQRLSFDSLNGKFSIEHKIANRTTFGPSEKIQILFLPLTAVFDLIIQFLKSISRSIGFIITAPKPFSLK